MPGHRSMSEHRRSVLSAEREIASLDGYARDSCPGCGGVRIGGAVLMTTAYEGSTARLAERPSRPRWAPSPWVQALRVRLARVPAAGALLRGRRRDEYSVQQLTCPVCPIRKEGVHDGSLGRRACVRQVSPPPVDDRLGARLPRGGAEPSLRARPRSRPGSERGIWWAVLEKRPSTRFGQEPCLGANTNSRRPGTVARRRLAFAGVRADTSPGTIRVRSPPAACCPGVPVESGVVGTLARLARKGVASPAGRSIEARGEERRGVRASRAHAARTTSVARLGAQVGTVLARPAAVGIVARSPLDAAPGVPRRAQAHAVGRAPDPPSDGAGVAQRRDPGLGGGLGVGHPGPRVLAPVDREQDVRVLYLRGGRPSPVHDRQQVLPLVTRQGHHVPYACHACRLRGDGGTHLEHGKDYDLTNH